MKSFYQLVSILLLFVLGSALGTEAFGKSSHVPKCNDGSAISVSKSNKKTEVLQGSCSESRTQPVSENCADPCHVGVSHFGHCAFVSADPSIHPLTLGLSSPKNSFQPLSQDGPHLEGPRRPPRHT